MCEPETNGIVKTGKIELGKTPSVVSGDHATAVVDSEPVVAGEETVDPGLVKLGNLIY